MLKFLKIFFIIWIISIILYVGIIVGVIIEHSEPTVYYREVDNIAKDDFSLHMNVIDFDKFINSYKTSLQRFAIDNINENGADICADLCWYRDVAEQLGIYPVYDSARTIIKCFKNGDTASEIQQTILCEYNKLLEELK